MASDSEDGGDVAPVEAAPPAEAVSDPSPSAEEVAPPPPAPENEPAKAGGGAVVPAAGAESSNPEGLSLNYEVRNLTPFFFLVCPVWLAWSLRRFFSNKMRCG